MFLLSILFTAALCLGMRSLHSLLGYASSINSAAPLQANAITTNETNFVAQNNNWIFTEQYDLFAVTAAGATIAQAQIFDATYNAVNIPQVYPLIYGGIVPPSNPNIMDLRKQPWPLPMNEQVQFQIANAAGGAEEDYGLIWICPSNSAPWNQSPPTPTIGAPRVRAVMTATVATTAAQWSAFVNVTFTNTLKGGVYQINDAYWIVAHALAYRHNFPKSPLYNGRKLTPGGLVENAYGNVPWKAGTNWAGVHGWFNYFEPFQVAFLGTTSESSATYTGIVDMTYMGNNFPPGVVPGT